jgi:hypothetical protein
MTAPRIAVALVLVAAGMVAAFVKGEILAGQPRSQEGSRMETDDDRLVRVEEKAPGFGGMFIDPDGRLAVYLLDSAELPPARSAIESVFGASRVPSVGVRALKGQYTISQLKAWTERTGAFLEMPGVTMVDLDEATNRVAIGVADESRTEAVRQALSSLGIPRAAVAVQVTGQIRPVNRR